MALKGMLEKIAKGEELKFEYIGTTEDNGTLLVGADIKAVARLTAKANAGITSDSKIAKGTCSLKEGTYTFACSGVKPRKDHVKAAIKRAWSGFSDPVKVTGPDGREEEDGVTPTPTQSTTQSPPRPTSPPTRGGTTPPRTGGNGTTPQTVTPPPRPTSPPPRTVTPTPKVDPKLTEARQKVKLLLTKVEQALTLLPPEFTQEVRTLQSNLQATERETNVERVGTVLEQSRNSFTDVVNRAKAAREEHERQLTEAREGATNLLNKIDTAILPKLTGTKATQVTQLRTTLEETSRGTDVEAIKTCTSETVTKIKEVVTGTPTPETPSRGPTRTPETPPRSPSRTPPSRPPEPKTETPRRDPAEEDRQVATETLNLLNGFSLPPKALIGAFVDPYNTLSNTYNQINQVKDPAKRLEQRLALREKITKLKGDAEQYAPARTEVDQVREQCKVYFNEARPGVLVKAYNKLLNDFNAHTELTDTGACVTKIKELRNAFVAFNNDRERLARDYAKARDLMHEMSGVIPQRGKEFLNRLNEAGSPDELRSLLSELQQLKDEGPAKSRLATNTVNTKSPAELKNLPPEKRIELVTDLRRGPETTKAERQTALAKLYKAMELEPDFQEKDSGMRRRVLARLKEDPILKEAKTTWDSKSTEEKVGVLRQALKLQCQEMGIPEGEMPEIKLFSQPSEQVTPQKKLTCEGFFSPKDGKIYINDTRSSFTEDFDDSLDTIIHENTHNYQHKLVKKLEAGEIKKGDPEYNQAVLFQLNFSGYLNSEDEGTESYEKQPVEMHAWQAGREAHLLFVEDAKSSGALLLGKVKTLIRTYPAHATKLQVIQGDLERALEGKKSGAIEKATESARTKVLEIVKQIQREKSK